jgi:hypothetical protein
MSQENKLIGSLLKLADLGITAIRISYSGGGDDGSIDEVLATRDNADDFEDVYSLDFFEEIDSENRTMIADWCVDKLLNEIENWWDDNGGYGYLYIKIPSGEYKIENNVTYIETYNHSGKILDV